MVHIVTLPNGDEAEFPDEMSDEQISSILAKQSPRSELQSQSLDKNILGLAPDVAGGILKSLQNVIPQPSQLFGKQSALMAPFMDRPDVIAQLVQPGRTTVDPYKLLGTQEQPFTTAKGAAQLAGELVPFSPAISKLSSAIISKPVNVIRNIYKAAKEQPLIHDLPPKPEFPELKLPKVESIQHTPESSNISNDLLDKLGKGSSNKEEAATKLADMIRNKHNQRVEESGVFFEYPMKLAGKERLYEHVDPLITTTLDKEMQMMKDLKGLNVGSLYDKFKNSPTIENAHLLKSELGSVIGDLERNTQKTASDRETISNIRKIRKRLEDNIISAFKRYDAMSNENLTPMYQRGVEFHRENVEPFRSTPELREITVEGVRTPRNIESVFHTPTDIVKGGETKIGPINKVINDLPDEAKDLILFNKIGASKNINEPKNLLESLKSAKNEGYSSYFNPYVEKSIKNIEQKLIEDEKNKKLVELSYKKIMDEAKSAHKLQVKNALLQHKIETDRIKELNKLNLKKHQQAVDSKNKLNKFLLGTGAALLGAGVLASKLGKLSDLLSSGENQ